MLSTKYIQAIVRSALREDIGSYDITTSTIISPSAKGQAQIIAKENGVICGIDIAKTAFAMIDENIRFIPFKKDGDRFNTKDTIAVIKGRYRTILTAERVALNFLSLLSGISTTTRSFITEVKGTKAKIMDTRKTTPNLRELEKYAVRVGGGCNHRKSLSDGIIVKDNHLKVIQSTHGRKLQENKIYKLISALRKRTKYKVEIEVENLKEFDSVIKFKPDIIMLDNFTLRSIQTAITKRNKNFPEVKLEASGRVNLSNVRQLAQEGVDYISIGLLTHSPCTIDFSLEIR